MKLHFYHVRTRRLIDILSLDWVLFLMIGPRFSVWIRSDEFLDQSRIWIWCLWKVFKHISDLWHGVIEKSHFICSHFGWSWNYVLFYNFYIFMRIHHTIDGYNWPHTLDREDRDTIPKQFYWILYSQINVLKGEDFWMWLLNIPGMINVFNEMHFFRKRFVPKTFVSILNIF